MVHDFGNNNLKKKKKKLKATQENAMAKKSRSNKLTITI